MRGIFITFEGTEGSGKSTQIKRLSERLQAEGQVVLCLREPGGTPIGEEIRHTLKHSATNQNMAPETELLLMNASRAQLVREVIRPALEAGKIVLCDRFTDSTVAYQGYGRALDLTEVQKIVHFATGGLSPDLTLFLQISLATSEARRKARANDQAPVRDRMEEADRSFFQRVEDGYEAIAMSDRDRVQIINADQDLEVVEQHIWKAVKPVVDRHVGQGVNTYKSLGEWKLTSLSEESDSKG